MHIYVHNSTICNNQKVEPGQMSIGTYIPKLWDIHILEYSSVIKNEVLIHAMMWRNTSKITLSKRSQKQEVTYSIIPVYQISRI